MGSEEPTSTRCLIVCKREVASESVVVFGGCSSCLLLFLFCSSFWANLWRILVSASPCCGVVLASVDEVGAEGDIGIEVGIGIDIGSRICVEADRFGIGSLWEVPANNK